MLFLMFYVASSSGGKDSNAQAILIHEHKEPCQAMICTEVMFDLQHAISGENPEHVRFIKEVVKPMIESWGYEFIILHADKDYLDLFYHTMERATKYPEHIGKRYGFPIQGQCNVKRDLKIKPIENYLKKLNQPYIQYIGIAADEKPRLESMRKHPEQYSILNKYGVTEEECKDMCRKYGLLSPTYDLGTNRQGCWFCPNAKFCEHKHIREIMPEVWYRYLALENEDNLAFDHWSCYSDESLHDREEQFKLMDLRGNS